MVSERVLSSVLRLVLILFYCPNESGSRYASSANRDGYLHRCGVEAATSHMRHRASFLICKNAQSIFISLGRTSHRLLGGRRV
ncbi:hypothetical protein F5Y16DRAFT_373677 [Xylariaceae sp. FL0255]|nr:hypothetical protein F5Y16DRAFT_373677 [Xylariaceae sp. FL0255]